MDNDTVSEFPAMPGTDIDAGIELIVRMVQEEHSRRSACPLPYAILVQADSLASVQRKLPQFLVSLASDHREGHWTLDLRTREAAAYMDAHPECQRYVMQGNERVRNPAAMPLVWVIAQLTAGGHLPALGMFKFRYENADGSQWYMEILGFGLRRGKSEGENPYLQGQTHLARMIRERGMQRYQTFLQAVMYDYRIGVPILQRTLANMASEEGFAVLCVQHEREGEIAEGIVFSPQEFARMPLQRVVRLLDEMGQQGPRPL